MSMFAHTQVYYVHRLQVVEKKVSGRGILRTSPCYARSLSAISVTSDLCSSSFRRCD